MSDYMLCNFKNCNTPLIKCAWITRCSHALCDEHGSKYFSNNLKKVKCPVCSDLWTKETDIIRTNLNPPDMIISCLRPEKAIEYAAQAAKFWAYQMDIKRKINVETINSKYEKMALSAASKVEMENKGLKRILFNIEEQLKLVNKELIATKQRLSKYKAAYESISSMKRQNDRFHSFYKHNLFRKPRDLNASFGTTNTAMGHEKYRWL